MFGKRPLWPYLLAAVAVLATTAFALTRLSEPDLIPIDPAGGAEVTIAGRVTVEPAAFVVRWAVTARVTISADRAVTLRKLTVKVQDEAGAPYDFPELTNVELSMASREIELHGELTMPGDYTYYLAYQLDGDWISLPPWQHLTIS